MSLFAGLGLSGFVERPEHLVIGDGGGEVLEVEFGVAPGEEFFRPKGDGAGWKLGVGLAGWGDPEFSLLGYGQERGVCD